MIQLILQLVIEDFKWRSRRLREIRTFEATYTIFGKSLGFTTILHQLSPTHLFPFLSTVKRKIENDQGRSGAEINERRTNRKLIDHHLRSIDFAFIISLEN